MFVGMQIPNIMFIFSATTRNRYYIGILQVKKTNISWFRKVPAIQKIHGS